MAAATANGLRFVGVMETEDRRGKPDFAQEKARALGPPLVNDHAPIPSTGLFETKLGQAWTVYRIPLDVPNTD